MKRILFYMKISRDCTLVFAVCLLIIGLIELSIRISGLKFEPSLYEPHPILYTVFRPNAEGWTSEEGENYVRINSLGMRDRERTVQSQAGTIRLALLGDSMVAAQQVRLEETMAQVMEQALDRTMKGSGQGRVEVLNFGVGGYALSQMYLSLNDRIWAFHPNIIAVFVSGFTVPNSYRKTKSMDNLPFFSMKGTDLIPDPENNPPEEIGSNSKFWHKVFGDLHNQFRVLQLVRAAQQTGWQKALAWSKTTPSTQEKPKPDELMRIWPYLPPKTSELAMAWNITEAILGRMIAEARKHGVEFWLIQIGSDIDEDPREAKREQFLQINHLASFDYATQRYADFAARQGVYFLDLGKPMREYSTVTHTSLRGFFNTIPYKGHWNESGNAAAANIVRRELLQRSRVFSSILH